MSHAGREVDALGLPRADVAEAVELVGDAWEALSGGRVLMTGGTGFIGRWMLSTVLAANRERQLGAQITMVSRDPEGFKNRHPELKKRGEVEWLTADLSEAQPLADAAFDCVISAATDVAREPGPDTLVSTAREGTRWALQATRQGGRMLLLSSGAVYRPADGGLPGVDEEWPAGPDSPTDSAYATAKRTSEDLCVDAAAGGHLAVAVARIFSVMGPGMPMSGHFAAGSFLSDACQGRPITIQGDGLARRSYLYAADTSWWLWTMALRQAPGIGIFNVGGSESVSIAEFAERVRDVVAPSLAVLRHGGTSIGRAPAASAYVPDVGKARDELGLTVRIDLDEAIRRTAAWARA